MGILAPWLLQVSSLVLASGSKARLRVLATPASTPRSWSAASTRTSGTCVRSRPSRCWPSARRRRWPAVRGRSGPGVRFAPRARRSVARQARLRLRGHRHVAAPFEPAGSAPHRPLSDRREIGAACGRRRQHVDLVRPAGQRGARGLCGSGRDAGPGRAFGVEGHGGPFVDGIEGSPSNVLGLSLPLFRTLLAEVGVRITDLWNDRSQPPA